MNNVAATQREFSPTRAASPRELAFSQALKQTLRENRGIITLSFAFVVLANALLEWRVGTGTRSWIFQLPVSLIINLTMIAYLGGIQIAIFTFLRRPKHPVQALWAEVTRPDVWPTLVSRILVFVPASVLAIATFSRVKQNIGLLHPFSFDDAFVAMDALLHGGYQPWQLLQPVLGSPIVTDALDYAYYCWFPVFYVTLFWQVFTLRRPALRQQFLLAFFASWIVMGSIAALAFSSAGPAFLAKLGLDATQFDGLMSYLEAVRASGHSINALVVQDFLWQAYTTDLNLPYKGISAMPSMHVAIAVLMALLGWRVHWLAGVAYSIFAVLIFLGSIHLAFHYAVDGYVAGAMVIAIWYISGKLTADRSAADAANAVCA